MSADLAAQSSFQQVAAIFSEHCVRCHNETTRKGDFSLSGRQELFDSGMVDPGDTSSQLLTVISGPDQSMPKEASPLDDDEVELIRHWIADGAKWPADAVITETSKADKTWWSLQPIARPTSEVGIDQFVDEQLHAAGLKRNSMADRRTLIRRATYDLTGLPPTPDEVTAFVDDADPSAFENLIDRLLASSRYGERWGRHWLDVVRFGESNGFERNVVINDLWPFRDYVIQSFNDDKPFDQFLREHVAGDVIGGDQQNGDDIAAQIGSAFLVAGPYDNVGNQDAAAKAQIRANTIDEMIRATSEAFLGLTIGCARCHNHKFDPILQSDYHKLYATFAGTRHGNRTVATATERKANAEQLAPLNQQKSLLVKQRGERQARINRLAKDAVAKHADEWTRTAVDRTGTTEQFKPVTTKHVRLICESLDTNVNRSTGFNIDEFEIWTSEPTPRNVALASSGSIATGASRTIEDFAGAYGPQLAIDGKFGARFISAGNELTIELAKPTEINRVVFSAARTEAKPEQSKFAFVADYRIEVSVDGKTWTEIASGRNRKCVHDKHRDHRLRQRETSESERVALAKLDRDIAKLDKQIAAVKPLRQIWVGNHVAADAIGPFHIFVGGNPQLPGDTVTLTSMSMLSDVTPNYVLEIDAAESERRVALADWMVNENNPLTPRVIVNRLWHHHFGTGIVNTPSDFGYMGGRPSHPKLLDSLAGQLIDDNWRLKPMHKRIMMSQTYQQSGEYHADAAKVDADARLLWRFPPRRISAEEIRDTMLMIAGKLKMESQTGGPGFRLYRYLQDNVATYVPLDKHGPETYRRAVYHQNARASVIDLMTDFDQPDCAFSTARRVQTTTPLQALTTLNHQFTLDMAGLLADRLQQSAGDDLNDQIELAYLLCYGRPINDGERDSCTQFVRQHSLAALCRVLLNTSELIYVR